MPRTSAFIITIDGPAGVGKSTVAGMLAKRLKAAFLDTGAMYRAATLAAMDKNIDLSDTDKLIKLLDETTFEFGVEDDKMIVLVNGIDRTGQIRSPDVTDNVRYIACQPQLRDRLVRMQRQFARMYKKIVTEGRDQGTVAFPSADFKFFLAAPVGERAKRRHSDMAKAGIDIPIEQLCSQIQQRDDSDRGRAVGPLTPAHDAVTIETSDITAEQVVEKIFDFVNRTL